MIKNTKLEMHDTIFIVVVTPTIQLDFPEFICDNRRWMVADEGCDVDVAFYGDLEQAEELRGLLNRFDLVQDGLLKIRIDEFDRDEYEENHPQLKINYFYPEGLGNDDTPELPLLFPIIRWKIFFFRKTNRVSGPVDFYLPATTIRMSPLSPPIFLTR